MTNDDSFRRRVEEIRNRNDDEFSLAALRGISTAEVHFERGDDAGDETDNDAPDPATGP